MWALAFTVRAQQPEIKGGIANFIQEHTIYPTYSLQNCIQGTVKIAFKVNDRGQVYTASVADGLGIDLDDEALRLVKLTSGKWSVPSSYDTTSVLIVPVNFKLTGYGCERKTSAEIGSAIESYKSQEELIALVTNYYKSKRNGTAKAEDEARINRIKADLNIDDDYLDSRIELGMKKYRQGDVEGACKEFNFVLNMGSSKADELLSKYCK